MSQQTTEPETDIENVSTRANAGRRRPRPATTTLSNLAPESRHPTPEGTSSGPVTRSQTLLLGLTNPSELAHDNVSIGAVSGGRKRPIDDVIRDRTRPPADNLIKELESMQEQAGGSQGRSERQEHHPAASAAAAAARSGTNAEGERAASPSPSPSPALPQRAKKRKVARAGKNKGVSRAHRGAATAQQRTAETPAEGVAYAAGASHEADAELDPEEEGDDEKQAPRKGGA